MDIGYWFEKHVSVFLKNAEVTSPTREFRILALMEFETLAGFLILRLRSVTKHPRGNDDQLHPALVGETMLL